MRDTNHIGPAVAAALAEIAKELPDGQSLDLAELRLDLAADAGPEEIRRSVHQAIETESAQ